MRPTIFAVLGACVAGSASAEEIGDAAAGRALAEQICAECHAVTPDGAESPNLEAPSFTSVADMSSTTRASLFVWLTSTHPTMPDLILSAEEVDNLSSYILSLRSQ